MVSATNCSHSSSSASDPAPSRPSRKDAPKTQDVAKRKRTRTGTAGSSEGETGCHISRFSKPGKTESSDKGKRRRIRATGVEIREQANPANAHPPPDDDVANSIPSAFGNHAERPPPRPIPYLYKPPAAIP